MRVYQYDQQGYYTGLFEDIGDKDPIPSGFTAETPPTDEEIGGYHARLGPDRKWHVTHIKIEVPSNVEPNQPE